MQLQLRRVDGVVGTYGKSGRYMPPRMRWLEPAAADAFPTEIIVSDMFRSAGESLHARKTKRGSARPGYSGHNYGISIDVELTPTLKALGFAGVGAKRDFDRWMEARHWYCHRRDHRLAFESWHYDYYTPNEFGAYYRGEHSTHTARERKLQALYGLQFEYTIEQLQAAWQRLGLYHGAIDGDFGPLSEHACRAFQRAWLLVDDGEPGPMTQRTTAYVTATKNLMEPPTRCT